MTYPATTYAEGVELTITSGNQLHEIINGDATEEINTESGMVPSVRKALADSMLFKPAIAWAEGSVESDPFQTRLYGEGIYWAPAASNETPISMGNNPTTDSNWFLAPVTGGESISRNTNLLSNHNFLIKSPDNITHPSAAPTDYVSGTQVFSGVFVGDDIVGLTYIDGRVSWTSGTLYFSVPNSGALGYVDQTDFVASVADFDGKPRTRGVSFALVGDEYRVTVGIDALEDVDANQTLLGSVKFEQGGVATGHDITEASPNIYRGLWPDTGGSANKGDTYQTQVSGTPTGQYFTALQNTTVDPVGDDVNWREVVTTKSVTTAQNDIVDGSIFKGSNDAYVQNGDMVPVGATHLRVLVGGETTIVAMSPVTSGVVSSLSIVGCVIGSEVVYFERIKKNTTSTLEQFGGANDYYDENGNVNPSPTDNYPALLRLIESKTVKLQNPFNPSIGKIQLQAGGYYFATPLSMKVVSFIEGVGSGASGGQATTLVFGGENLGVGACAGITYQRFNTDETSSGLVTTTSASDGSILKGVRVIAKNKVLQPTLEEYEQTNSGLWMRARAIWEDVVVEGFGGHGRMISATTGGIEASGNANLWQNIRCASHNNGYHGLYVSGADSNAGLTISDNDTNNNGNGIKDDSFLGNTHIASHLSANSRDEHYVTYDAGSGVQRWWFVSDNASNVSVTPGADPTVWALAYGGSVVADSRPWTGSNVVEQSGAIWSGGSNNFIGLYTEGGAQGPIALSDVDFVTFTTNGAGISQRSLNKTNTILLNGSFANLDIKKPDGTSTPIGVEYFVRDYSPCTYKYGTPNGVVTNIDNVARVIGDTIIAGQGISGFTQAGVVSTNNDASTDALRRGDFYVEKSVRVGGSNGVRLGYGSVVSGVYYRRGDILIQLATPAGVSYKQCTTAGLGGSTAVFTDATLD